MLAVHSGQQAFFAAVFKNYLQNPISVEIDGGRASGTMEDITVGSYVTLTINGKGKITNVLVSSRSGFRTKAE